MHRDKRLSRRLVYPAVFGIVGLVGAAQSHASLLGDTVSLEWGGVKSGPWTLSSLAVEVPGGFLGPTVVGTFSPTFLGNSSGVDVNVEANTATASEFPDYGGTSFTGPSAINGFVFNGFVLFDETTEIIGATIGLSTVQSFTPSEIAVIDGSLWVNFAGFTVSQGEEVVIDVNNAIPEPSTWAMLLTGLGLLGCRRLRTSLKKHWRNASLVITGMPVA